MDKATLAQDGKSFKNFNLVVDNPKKEG